MPRKSAASLSVVPPATPPRPKAPAELTKPQAQLWDRIVGEMPYDYFTTGSQPLLTQYVRHVETANLLAKHIDRFNVADLATDEGLDRYNRLTAMAARESGVIATLSVKMRLSQNSTYDRTKVVKADSRRKPWEFVS